VEKVEKVDKVAVVEKVDKVVVVEKVAVDKVAVDKVDKVAVVATVEVGTVDTLLLQFHTAIPRILINYD
jgi:hypothetical protein